MIGESIKELRIAKGLKQRDLASKAKISRVAIGNYERGDRQPPVDIAARIAEALGVSLDVLLEKENNLRLNSLHGIMDDLDYELEFITEEDKNLIIKAFQTTIEQISKIKMRSKSTQLLRIFSEFLEYYGAMITQNFEMRASIEQNGDGIDEYVKFLRYYDKALLLFQEHRDTLTNEALLKFNGGDKLKRLIYGESVHPGDKED